MYSQMFVPLRISLMGAMILASSGCAEVDVKDRNALAPVATGQAAIHATQLGRTLVISEIILSEDVPERASRMAQAQQTIDHTLASLPLHITRPEAILGAPPAAGWGSLGEANLTEAARNAGLDSVAILRIEDFHRRGELYVAIALPPVSWKTDTDVSVRLRVLDARNGAPIMDLRRDRVNGGMFIVRSVDDLPGELDAVLRSLINAG